MARNTLVTDRAAYVRRYGLVVLPYITLRKAANLALNALELRAAVPRPRSVPPFVKVESTPLCQLRCRACWHSSMEFKRTLRSDMRLTVERLSQIIEPVQKDVICVSLSYTGEPLLNDHLAHLIAYLHERRICTSFPSSLSVRMTAERARDLVLGGLDQILVSLDGATPETYTQYRVGGDFSRVLENVRLLADAKRRLGARRPYLVWKMVVFPHNAHETDRVRREYKALGFDGYEFVVDHGSAEQKAAWAEARAELVARRKPCYWAWNTAVIGWDGDVQPCCIQVNQISLGNASAAGGLRAVWRNEAYQALRQGFSRRRYGEAMHPVCRECLGLADPQIIDSSIYARAAHGGLDGERFQSQPVRLTVRSASPSPSIGRR